MKTSILVTLCFLLISCENSKQIKIRNTKSVINLLNESQVSLINQNLDSLYNTGVFNGFSVSMVDTSGIIFNRGVGYADVSNKVKYTKSTIQNIASISKVFIGMSLMKAHELGVLKLDDPINEYLPYEVMNPSFPEIPITIRHLATHTSSIVDTDIYMEHCYVNKYDVPLRSELMKAYDTYFMNSSETQISLSKFLNHVLDHNGDWYTSSTFSNVKPGSIYEYSNIGASLCALIIEKATKKPFTVFTREHIFEPLNMSSTGWFFKDVDMANHTKLYFDDKEFPYYESNSYPDGALITSNEDLSAFLIELLRGHAGSGRLLTAESYNELFASQLGREQFKKKNYNVGYFIEKELLYNEIGHSGGDPGTNTLMYFNSETNVGRIMVLNTDSDKDNSMDVYWGIWNTVDMGKYK